MAKYSYIKEMRYLFQIIYEFCSRHYGKFYSLYYKYYKKSIAPHFKNKSVIIVSSVLLSALASGVAGLIVSQVSPDNNRKVALAGISSGVPSKQSIEKNGSVKVQDRHFSGNEQSTSEYVKRRRKDDASSSNLKQIFPPSDSNSSGISKSNQFVNENGTVSSNVSFNGSLRDIKQANSRGLNRILPQDQREERRIEKRRVGNIRTKKLQLILNQSDTLKVPETYSTALIGNETIADVVPLSDQVIYLLGKSIGTTRLTVLNGQKKIIRIIEIEVSHDLSSIEKELKILLPKSKVKVKSLNGNVMLTGTVPDVMTLKRAMAFAERFTSNSVANALKVADPQQVMLEVRFLEANKQAAKEIGISWNVLANKFVGSTLLASPASSVSNISGVANGLVSGKVPFGTAVASLLNNGTSIDVLIQALENRNVARRLAEPNLVALSGDTASFLAGGEFPFSVVGPNQTVGTQFRKFGVSLEFTPTVMENGLINLRIVPEVSEIAPSMVELAHGAKSPTLLVRRVKTTVELRDGQSFAIAGLLQSTDYRIRNQLPWLGDIPIIGALFRSSAFQRKETDLVVIITPRLVNPAIPTQKLATPLDDTMASNDVDFFLKGKDETRIENKMQQNKIGHILKQDYQKEDGKQSNQASNNAVKNNKAVQTINPWPDYAKDVDFQVDGVRSMRTLESYYGASKDGASQNKGVASGKKAASE